MFRATVSLPLAFVAMSIGANRLESAPIRWSYADIGWNDFRNWTDVYGAANAHRYVVECPIPEPSTPALLSTSAVGVAVGWRRGRC